MHCVPTQAQFRRKNLYRVVIDNPQGNHVPPALKYAIVPPIAQTFRHYRAFSVFVPEDKT